MDERDVLAERFDAERRRLRAVAYRMLGSLTEAEDAGPSPDQQPATEFFVTAAHNLQEASVRAGKNTIHLVSAIRIAGLSTEVRRAPLRRRICARVDLGRDGRRDAGAVLVVRRGGSQLASP